MENFELSAYLIISGIGAASGIVFTNNSLYIVSDNAGFLYQYQLENDQLIKHQLIDNSSENILKKDKPDFEAITLLENELHIFGSGSTKKRNRKFVFQLQDSSFQEHDLSHLYQKIKTTLEISDDDLNIECAFYYNQDLYLMQRGNGVNSKNGIVKIDSKENIQFQTVQLPKIKHVETSFTDAIVVNNKIYFLACAEDTLSTYDDGEVLGSIIGCINMETFNLEFTYQISTTNKFEGITLYKKIDTEITFLLCEDNDTEDLESTIYSLKLPNGY